MSLRAPAPTPFFAPFLSYSRLCVNPFLAGSARASIEVEVVSREGAKEKEGAKKAFGLRRFGVYYAC